MPIRELLWDDWNLEHIARHRITTAEVEDVCFGDPWDLRAGGGKRSLYGQTDAGRYVLVIVVSRGEGLFYPISARDMTQAERRRYQDHGR